MSLQRVAISATVPDPAGIVARYLVEGASPESAVQNQGSAMSALAAATIVEVTGGRQLVADIQPMRWLEELVTALALRNSGQATFRKTLLFCNTRNEVEQVAAYLRQHLPYEAAIFVHYSNLDPALRQAVERGFAESSVAICVSSSTLELDIDIGSIDDVVLLGPPPTRSISYPMRMAPGSFIFGAISMGHCWPASCRTIGRVTTKQRLWLYRMSFACICQRRSRSYNKGCIHEPYRDTDH